MSPDRIRPGSARGSGSPRPPRGPAADDADAPGTPSGDADAPGTAPRDAGAEWVPGAEPEGAASAPEDDSEAVPEAGDGTGEAEKRVEEADLEVPAPLDGSPGGTETAGEGDLTGGEAVRHGRRPAGAGARRGERPATPAPAGEPTGARPVRSGFFSRLYHGETNLEFVGRRRIWFAISALVILAGIVSLATRGLNLDIQFSGGTSWTVQWPGANVTQARDALAGFNLSGSTITVLGQAGGSSRSLQVEAKIPKGQTPAQTQAQLVKVEDTIARIAHVSPSEVSITSVGPSWGGEVTKKAIEALIVFFVLVALYISVFFEWRMALSAIVAVLHDILVVVGIYSLTGFDVTPDTVVAILTILGYSLYDTIVVFDRIRDNLKGVGAVGRLTISDVVNLSMNQTLARSINTSLVAILPIFAVLVLGAQILGATTLQYFGWALLIGLASGAYSSIFIASPIVAVLKEREPRWARIRERTAAARGGELLVLSPAAVAAGLLGGEGPGGDRRSRASRTARSAAPQAAPDGDEQRLIRPGGTSTGGPPSGASRPRAARPGTGRAGGRPSGGARRKGGRR